MSRICHQAFALLTLLSFLLPVCLLAAEPPVLEGAIVDSYQAPDANQAVAIDDASFYAINNSRITRHDRQDGKAVTQWRGGSGIIHLDSGLALDDRLYAAHSNYPRWPMASSVEIFDAANLEHLASHPFPGNDGSMTWLDRHDGSWWGGFAGYDLVQPGQDHPYGGTASTRIVRMDDGFAILDSYTIPAELLDRMRPMSNSGGSWGPDGYLYLTGHDLPEIYVMALPDTGDELIWKATVIVRDMAGQGIAWDRTGSQRELWGIVRAGSKILRIRLPEVAQ